MVPCTRATRRGMTTLLCFGLGYCAHHYIAEYGGRFERVVGTARSREKAESIQSDRAIPIIFDGTASSELSDAIASCEAVLVSVPPTETGDPVLAVCSEALARAPKLKSIIYLSTVGVYGNHDGAWVDENTVPEPTSARARARIAAELAWHDLATERRSVAVLRLAGIYGPGRSALRQVRAGAARRIVKPGQVFSRIHVADIAQVIDVVLKREARGIFNVCDDEPAPPQDVTRFAADLLGIPPPPEIRFADAAKDLSAMALSFYAECRRVRNDRIKQELGVVLRYATYRDGLQALAAQDEGTDESLPSFKTPPPP
jgi:nucleoside-diphosphate-sugar epimerase